MTSLLAKDLLTNDKWCPGVWAVGFRKDLKLENKTRQKKECCEGDGGRTLWLENRIPLRHELWFD